MSTIKKTGKSKMVSEDLNDLFKDSQFLKNPPKAKKTQRRQNVGETEDEDMSKLLGLYQANPKKKRPDLNVEEHGLYQETRQKLLHVMEDQLNSRKEGYGNFLRHLSEVVAQLEADHDALKDNEKKLEHFASIVVKCMQQATASQKKSLKTLKEIHISYKQRFEELDKIQKLETVKLADDLEENMNQLQQKLVSDTKRKQFENLRRTIFQFQNDF